MLGFNDQSVDCQLVIFVVYDVINMHNTLLRGRLFHRQTASSAARAARGQCERGRQEGQCGALALGSARFHDQDLDQGGLMSVSPFVAS